MKNSIVTILFVLLTTLISFSQTSLEVKPVYIGMILVDELTPDRMAKVCEEYDLIESGVEEDYMVYANKKDGSKIRFKVEDTPKGHIPVVQVISKEKSATVKKIINDAGFTKSSDGEYYKGSQFTHKRTKCRISSGSPLTITFTKVYRSDD